MDSLEKRLVSKLNRSTILSSILFYFNKLAPTGIIRKRCEFAYNRPLSRTLAKKLQLNCSPKQVAGWFKIEYLNDENNGV
jgi:hypothetical protein